MARRIEKGGMYGERKFNLVNRAREKVWKFYVSFMTPGYKERGIATRKGTCNNCGECCFGCKYRVKKSAGWRCGIFNDPHRQKDCSKFPRDSFELMIRGCRNCSYYWPDDDWQQRVRNFVLKKVA
jgi:hypothetical protein